MTCPSARRHEVTQAGRDPGCPGSQPYTAAHFGSHPTWSLHHQVQGMQVVGNKASCLCPKRYAPSSSLLPQVTQEPWGDVCTKLFITNPSVPHVLKDGTGNTLGV